MTSQDHVNQLYDEFGSGLPFRTDYYKLLQQHGLRPNDVSREMLDEAEEHTKEQLKRKFHKEPKRKIPLSNSQSADRIVPASAEPIQGRSKTMNVAECEARQLLVAIGREIAADQRRYPISRLEKRLNETNDKGVLTIVAESKDPGEQRLKDLLISVADAKQEGDTIVIVPDGKPAETNDQAEVNEEDNVESTPEEVEATEENATMPAIAEPIKRKRGRPRKNPEVNGTAPPASDGRKHAKSSEAKTEVIKHKPINFTELEKPRLLKVTHNLAKRFKEMERYPRDRDLQPSRCDFLRTAIRTGLFRGSEWVSCRCKETGLTYRLNGKHTSAVLCDMYEADEEVPEITQLVREYECDTLEDMAHLFASFDPSKSARNKNDIVRGFAATAAETANLPPRMLNLVTTGLAFNVWERSYRRQSAQEQSLLLLQNLEFAEWLTEMLHNKKGIDHVRRMPVVAAMARTWKKDPKAADEFWGKIRDDCDDPKNAPTRTLYRWLLGHKIGAVRKSEESVSDREAFVRCLMAWNAWRQEEATVTARYADDMDTPVAV